MQDSSFFWSVFKIWVEELNKCQKALAPVDSSYVKTHDFSVSFLTVIWYERIEVRSGYSIWMRSMELSLEFRYTRATASIVTLEQLLWVSLVITKISLSLCSEERCCISEWRRNTSSLEICFSNLLPFTSFPYVSWILTFMWGEDICWTVASTSWKHEKFKICCTFQFALWLHELIINFS